MCFLVVTKESERELGLTCVRGFLHKSIRVHRVSLVGAVERIESIPVIRIVQVLFEGHGDITGTLQSCQVMEEIEIVLIELVGAFEEFDH